VLRLWPETLYVGLFPGQCWLQSRRIAAEPSLCLAQATDTQALLSALETMLDDKASLWRKGSRVVLSVSDSVGALLTMPWQEELRSPDELSSYATVCFENQGVVIDENWVMRTEFRQHCSTGIAYALPQAWLSQLRALLDVRGLRLQRVLPISAAAYCAESSAAKQGKRLILLQEAYRISAFIYEGQRLVAFDVEPIVTSKEVSGKRLLRRISARYGEIAQAGIWSPELPEQAPAADYISNCLTDVTVQTFTRSVWE
jgi:hypothetical protein